MANWCSNELCLEHADPTMIARISDAFVEGRLFREFVPLPACLVTVENAPELNVQKLAQRAKSNFAACGYRQSSDFACENWGPKWEVDAGATDFFDANSATLTFSTAGAAPIPFYKRLKELGFQVTGLYLEEGDQYAGIWENGHQQHIQGWDNIQELPQEICEAFDVYDREDDEGSEREENGVFQDAHNTSPWQKP